MNEDDKCFTDKDRRMLETLTNSSEHSIYWRDDLNNDMKRMRTRLDEIVQYCDKRAIVTEERCARLERNYSLLEAQFSALKAGLNGNG